MSAVKVAVPDSPKGGRSKTPKAMSAEVSPDSKCPICLDAFHDMSYLDRCLHKFCFRCILEWSKNKPECPLCKQPFSSIYHSIKSDQDFQKYEVKRQVESASFGYFEGVRFRYRTTLTGVHRQMRRTSPPPDNGVMFEASVGLTQQTRDRYIRRMMTRLAARRRAASEGRAVGDVREQEMINFRRELYRRGVRVLVVRDGGRCRDTSAEFYRRNPACLHRLVPWLKRELMVLYGAHGSLVNIVQHIIMSRITRYDMEDGAIQEELRPFLQGRTEHFLHEFVNFAKSPFNMEAYDQHAVYDCPAPSSNEQSSSGSSVIAISEDEESPADAEPAGNSAATLGQSAWDDETPGPSYSTATEPGRPEPPPVLDLDSESSSDEDRPEFGASPQRIPSRGPADAALTERSDEDRASSDGDDCVFVGYVKPTSERTPELVQLSSDSDDSSVVENKEAPLPSQHIRFASCSPAASRGSSSSGAEHVRTGARCRSSSQERPGSSAYRNASGGRADRSGARERPLERRESKERDRRRRRSHSTSRGRKRPSRSPAISHTSFGSHSSGGHFSKSDRTHARRDSYQSYTCYRRQGDGVVTRYTQRQSYYYSRRGYSHGKSRSRSRDSPPRRERPRRPSSSRTHSSSCSPSPERRSHHDKPAGKRQLKTKHLEEPPRASRTPSAQSDAAPLRGHEKKSKERRRRRSREGSRRRGRSGSTERHKHHHHKKKKKKKKHKKKSKKSKSAERTARSSPVGSDKLSANRSLTPVSRPTELPFIHRGPAADRVNPAPPEQSSQPHDGLDLSF